MSDNIRGALSVGTSTGEIIYLAAGNNFYKLSQSENNTLSSTLLGTFDGAAFASDSEEVEIFLFAEKVCILAGGEYFVYDGATFSVVEGYSPLIMKNTTSLGVGEEYERVNLLTNKARIRFITDGTSREYRINLPVASVDAVYFNGTKLASSEYSVYTRSNYTSVNTTSVYSSSATENDLLMVCFTLDQTSERSRVTSCKKAVVYGGDTDSRVFFWNGNEISTIFPSEPVDAENGQSISYDYFPVGTPVSVGEGNLPVSGTCRQFDRLAIFTADSAYYTYPKDEGVVNNIRRFSFPILPLNSDIGASEKGGAILVENEPYSLSRGSLYKFKSTSVRDERLAIRIEPPSSFKFTSDSVNNMKLYANKLRGELWCYDQGGVAVYNARNECWYRFTGFDADRIFTFGGEAAYYKGKKLFIPTSSYSDVGLNFDAYVESYLLDLENAFERKNIKKFGVVIGPSDESRSVTVKLTADCGVYPSNDTSETAHDLRIRETQFSSPPSDLPTVFTLRSGLRRVRHFKLKISSPPDGKYAQIREFSVTTV